MPSDAADRFLASCVGALIAEGITLPIDTTKVRLQVQKSGAGDKVRYSGMMDCLATTAREEGVGGLFKGLAPALIRQVSYSSLTLILYEPIRDSIASIGRSSSSAGSGGSSGSSAAVPFWQRLLAAGTSGAIGIAVMNPTEILKTQLQASGENLTMAGVVRKVWAADGITGFWAGGT